MFTGIITAKGKILAAEHGVQSRFELEVPYRADDIALGASIAHAGVCLTVLDVRPVGVQGARYWVEVSPETLQKTHMAQWRVGDEVNLERSLRMGDELGGHLVWGHVDGLGEVLAIEPTGDHHVVRFRAPQALVPLIAAKGSIAVDGVSLTINAVSGDKFAVNIIPHTWAITSLGRLVPGAQVHLEADPIARYVARFLEAKG